MDTNILIERMLKISEELGQLYSALVYLELSIEELKDTQAALEITLMDRDPKKNTLGWVGSNDTQRSADRLDKVLRNEQWKRNDSLLGMNLAWKKHTEAQVKVLETERRALENIAGMVS